MDGSALGNKQKRFSGFFCFGHYFGRGYFCCVNRAVREPN